MNNLTFETYGRLWALNPVGKDEYRHTLWQCLCECGNKIVVRAKSLRNGDTRSCGCLHKETCKTNGERKTHGLTGSPTYISWQAMKRRCLKSQEDNYPRYGGRGIEICDRWLNSFENFLADMGKRPEDLTLDRINNEGNYEPSNCRWATLSEQNSNRKSWAQH